MANFSELGTTWDLWNKTLNIARLLSGKPTVSLETNPYRIKNRSKNGVEVICKRLLEIPKIKHIKTDSKDSDEKQVGRKVKVKEIYTTGGVLVWARK